MGPFASRAPGEPRNRRLVATQFADYETHLPIGGIPLALRLGWCVSFGRVLTGIDLASACSGLGRARPRCAAIG